MATGNSAARRSAWGLWPAATAAAWLALALTARGPRDERQAGTRRSSGAAARGRVDGSGGTVPKPGDHDRGEAGHTTIEPPATAFQFGMQLFKAFSEDRVLLIAAGVTFYGLLAMFPAIGAFVSIYGLVADAHTINDHLATLQDVLPGGAFDVVGEQIKRLTEASGGALGLTAAFGIGVSIWSANGGMKAVFDALNIVDHETEKRNFIRLNIQSLAFTAGMLVFGIIALTSIVVVPAILNTLGLPPEAWYIALLRWPALILVILLALAALYAFGPSRTKPRWRWVTWGSGAAAIAWVVVSGLFSWYVANFGSYNKTYGSLGAAIGFMTWIWISTTIVLIGAEVNSLRESMDRAD